MISNLFSINYVMLLLVKLLFKLFGFREYLNSGVKSLNRVDEIENHIILFENMPNESLNALYEMENSHFLSIAALGIGFFQS